MSSVISGRLHILGGDDKSVTYLRTQNVFAAKSVSFVSLPPTEVSLLEHIKRSALATIISKSSHVAKLTPVDFTSYGWKHHADALKPIYTSKEAMPSNIKRYVKCLCKKR